MKYEILLAPQAIEDLNSLEAPVRSGIREALKLHLLHEPTKLSKSRIKRLRGLEWPQYRLRVGEIRVFYDVVDDQVEVLAVVPKSQAAQWLAQFGEPK